jgi:polyphosphate kinase
VSLDHPALYLNKELGAIDLVWRVFSMVLDETLPLLERVRFLAITASIVDELVQKRVGGLQRQRGAGVHRRSADGRTPKEQLALAIPALRQLHSTMTATWAAILKPALEAKTPIRLYDYDRLDATQRRFMDAYFESHIYKILTPLIVDSGHPFPHISNLTLSLVVTLEYPGEKEPRYARVKIPPSQRRWLPICDDPFSLLPIEDLIAHHLAKLFCGAKILSAHPFRVTRNADLERNEEVAEDLLAMISEELDQRRIAPVVRLEVAHDMPQEERAFLMDGLGLEPADVFPVDGLFDLTGCAEIAGLDLPDLQYEPWEPATPPPFGQTHETRKAQDIFALIRQGDILVHHPYDSFDATVQRLVEDAAEDPNVLAIKQTIYRTSDESPIVEALICAAKAGKQVAVMVEVKARFDEANNIAWAEMMEDAGIHVVFGLVGLKTHAKATLIVRQEGEMLRTYCHVGTGNYHPKTALVYTDLSLLTCDPELGRDLVNLFHHLTGYAPGQTYRKVLVAPQHLRGALCALIEAEIEHQRQNGSGHIIAKMNALDDVEMIQALYCASQAGVRVDLIVRAHCSLRPGLPGYSENIRVISILGRFLEHDRIFYFGNNGDARIYIGSADWRRRNLQDRIELLAPIKDLGLRARLSNTLELALQDNSLAWDMDSQGGYTRRKPGDGEAERNYHQTLMSRAHQG